MTDIGIGIIGAGRIGQLHAQNLLSMENVELKAISDIAIDHLENTIFSKRVPYITKNAESLFSNPDIHAIFICSSTNSHINFIKRAAEAGKHIFCEKPISFNLEETREALELVKKYGVKFQVGFNRRYDKHFRKAYELVRKGSVGAPQIVKITSRDPEIPPENYIKESGGLFIDMTIHDFDMLLYLSGREAKEVSVVASNLIDPIFGKYDDVDTAVITVKFDDESIGVIDNSRQAVYGYDQRIEVFGNKGAVTVENEPTTNVQVSTKESVTTDNPKLFFLERYMDSYKKEVSEFVSMVRENGQCECQAEDGLKAEVLALAAKTSWKENRSVEISEFSNRIKEQSLK